MKPKMIYIILTLIAIIAIVLYMVFKPKYSYYKTEIIPDTNLQMVIYRQNNFKTISIGSSNSSYALSYVELQDLDGNTLAKQNFFNRCKVQIGEVGFRMENNKLYFTKFSYIDLADYSYYCFK